MHRNLKGFTLVELLVVMGIILLFIGLSGVLLLFLAQSYRATRATLTRIKAFSDNLVENMPIGLLAMDNRQRIASFNQVAQSILGFAPEKAIGRNAIHVLPKELYAHLDRLVAEKGVIEKPNAERIAGHLQQH